MDRKSGSSAASPGVCSLPHAQSGGPSRCRVHRGHFVRLVLREGSLQSRQMTGSRTGVAHVDDGLSRVEAKAFPDGREERRPADEEGSVGMPGKCALVPFEHLCPGSSLGVIPVLSRPPGRSHVVGHYVCSQPPEVPGPVAGPRSKLDDRRASQDRRQKVRLWQDVGESVGEAEPASRLVTPANASSKAASERVQPDAHQRAMRLPGLTIQARLTRHRVVTSAVSLGALL